MKKILSTIIMIISISFSTKAFTNVSGGIYADITWTLANSPYIVVDNVVVFPGITLTIEPGVLVKFEDTKYLEIRQGTLIANGTVVDTITFTSNSLTPTPGIWGSTTNGGIWLNNAVASTSFNFITIIYATIGIYNAGNIHIKNSLFNNNLSGLSSIYGTQIDSCIFRLNSAGIGNSNGVIYNFCTISNNTNGIATLTGGSLLNCIIDSNQTGLGNSDGPKIHHCTISYNQTGMACDPCCGGAMIVQNCVVDSNSTVGLSINGNGLADSVMDNEIKFNGIGLVSATCPGNGGHSQFTRNIIENNTIGIQVGGCSDIYCNSFCNNTSYDLQNRLSTTISVPNNYWCTTDSAAIELLIYDGHDNSSYGLVNFMPLDITQCYLTTGILTDKTQSLSFNIFPNPASNEVTVELPSNNFRGGVKIFNVFGELTYSSILTKQKINVDISSWRKGAYIIQISNGEIISRRKLIIL